MLATGSLLLDRLTICVPQYMGMDVLRSERVFPGHTHPNKEPALISTSGKRVTTMVGVRDEVMDCSLSTNRVSMPLVLWTNLFLLSEYLKYLDLHMRQEEYLSL